MVLQESSEKDPKVSEKGAADLACFWILHKIVEDVGILRDPLKQQRLSFLRL